MRILTRYILKEIISHSLLGLLIFTFVVYIPHIGHLLELVVRHDISLPHILLLFLVPVPSILVLTIPMAVLLGTLIGLSRMAADGEVIGARACGISRFQFVVPVMIYAVAGWAVGLWMSLYLAPASSLKLEQLEEEVRTTQIPYQVQPRVFMEQFPNLLLYLEDVSASRSYWRGVFIVDSTDRQAPKVTLAGSGLLVSDPASGALTLHLERGATHQLDAADPARYSVVSFASTDLPLPAVQPTARPASRVPATMTLGELWNATRQRDDPVRPGLQSSVISERRAALVELHYRFALPMASLVLALVGIPLGLFTRKGGKAVGVLLAMLAVFVYYMVMAFGLSLAKQGRLPPAIGLWLANTVFAALGILMLAQVQHVRRRLQFLQETLEEGRRRFEQWRLARRNLSPEGILLHPRALATRVFQILDLYVVREWLFYLVVLLIAFAGVYMVFDFFQLLSDIVRNHAGPRLVLDYYRYLLPQIIYLMLPLSVLVATLVSFSLLVKTSQIVAVKSVGISLYRLSLPVLILAAVLSGAIFLLSDLYLPAFNQQQDALRNQIKGRPPQTFYRPDRRWIFGESNRIYNYRFYDPDRALFADLAVYELDLQRFRLIRRIYAARAFWEPHLGGWVLENGWIRDLDGDRVTYYAPFAVATFSELKEAPSYFVHEVKTSEQMSVPELRRYIAELQRSGFDVVRLTVQLERKFSYPVITFVVALIGIPFALTTGRKGALAGVAVSILIAIVYWSSSSLFEAMGNLNQLPPVVAAWSPDVLFGLGGLYLLLRVRT